MSHDPNSPDCHCCARWRWATQSIVTEGQRQLDTLVERNHALTAALALCRAELSLFTQPPTEKA